MKKYTVLKNIQDSQNAFKFYKEGETILLNDERAEELKERGLVGDYKEPEQKEDKKDENPSVTDAGKEAAPADTDPDADNATNEDVVKEDKSADVTKVEKPKGTTKKDKANG